MKTFFDLSFVPRIQYDADALDDPKSLASVKEQLRKKVDVCKDADDDYIDSPVFTYKIYETITIPDKSKIAEDSTSLKEMLTQADLYLESLKYTEAELAFKKVIETCQYTDNRLICHYILAMYKKDLSVENLKHALTVLREYIDLETTTWEDALGIAAAIYIRLFNITKEKPYLFSAIDYYRRGSNYESGTLYCARNYCASLLKASQIFGDSNILKEYYYTAVHNAKYYLNRYPYPMNEQNLRNRVWLVSNIRDLYLIAIGDDSLAPPMAPVSERQKKTIEQGRQILEDDLKNMKIACGIA